MMFIALGSLTLAISALLYWRCAVEQRAIRWELYAQRDELRRLAYEHPELRSSGMFSNLDRHLSLHCSSLHDLSIWAVLPAVVLGDRRLIEGRQRDFEARLNQSEHAVLIPVYRKTTVLLARHLMWRHMFLTVLSAVTIVGVVACYVFSRWVMSRVVSNAVTPTAIGLPARSPA